MQPNKPYNNHCCPFVVVAVAHKLVVVVVGSIVVEEAAVDNSLGLGPGCCQGNLFPGHRCCRNNLGFEVVDRLEVGKTYFEL